MEIRAKENGIAVAIEFGAGDLFRHYVGNVPFSFQPDGFNNTGGNGFPYGMEGNGNVLLLEVSFKIAGVLNDTKIISKKQGWV